MEEKKQEIVKISVRNLIEFILRTGDIDNTRTTGTQTINAMQEGSKVHRKIQNEMGAGYQAEVPLNITIPIEERQDSFLLCIEGRADGIIKQPEVLIDEIKGVYMDLIYLEEPIFLHRAQAMCYAYMYAKKENLSKIDIQVTYCQIETQKVKRFRETLLIETLEVWFQNLVKEYGKWAGWQLRWQKKRTSSIKTLKFPFLYRPGQKKLVSGVYQTILEEKKIFIEAPTGAGKTISVVYPAVKAIGEGLASKLFYTTARTTTAAIAQETFQILRKQGLKIKITTITAKEKLCVLEKPICSPNFCERAKGHYDRVNEAVFDLLTNEDEISRELIELYAEKYKVCPFEMCLDTTLWADGIICDYNYIFDPNVFLRRFFLDRKKQNYIFLIDEAHNLVERGREMYSAVLYKQDFLDIKALVKKESNELRKKLEVCNRDMLLLKKEFEEFQIVESISNFVIHLTRLLAEYEDFLSKYPIKEEIILELYLKIKHFLSIYDKMDDKYIIYTENNKEKGFRMKLQCMDPSSNLLSCLERGKSSIFFSATLLPISYYKEQLGGSETDYTIYIPSSFKRSNQLFMIGSDVSTKYTRRNQKEFEKIAEYIKLFVNVRKGNYLVFFPSYQMMYFIKDCLKDENLDFEIIVQKNNMKEKEREEFLMNFVEEVKETKVGFCVIGGIFSEGIDLKNDRLIGTIIIGTGLPMVCKERDLFRNYFNKKGKNGFCYAYQYPGMNKVLQAAGRVIRTEKDRGAILLLDERFLQNDYQPLFPQEWFPYNIVTKNNLKQVLEEFWNEKNESGDF